MENSKLFDIAKEWESVFWREHQGSGWTILWHEEITGLTHGSSQPCQQNGCQLGLNEQRTEWEKYKMGQYNYPAWPGFIFQKKKKGRTNPKAVQRSARLLLPPWVQRVQAAVKAAFPSSHGVGHLSRLLKARQPHRTLGRGWLSDGPEDRNDSEDDSSWAFK